MKCEHFLPFLETGGWVRRWQARRHARHCTRCAAARQMLVELKQELSASPELPPNLSQMWMAASAVKRPQSVPNQVMPRVRPRVIYYAAAAMALVVLMPLVLHWNAERRNDTPIVKQEVPDEPTRTAKTDRSRTGVKTSEIVVAMVDPSKELARLVEGVVQLESDVKKLADASRKLELEQRIDRLLARHSGW